MEMTISRAIINWDRSQKTQVQGYNTALTIALARSRVVRFAKVETNHPPSLTEMMAQTLHKAA